MKKKIKVGNVTLGDGNIYIQSMLNVRAEDIQNSVKQAKELEKAGCRIIRAAVPRLECAELIPALKNAVILRIQYAADQQKAWSDQRAVFPIALQYNSNYTLQYLPEILLSLDISMQAESQP